MQNDNDDDDDFDFVNAKNRGGGKEILLKVGVHEHMVDSSTAAEAAETEATNEHKQTDRKPDKTRAQKDAHNAACRMSRLKRKMDVEKLEADYLQTKKKFHKMQVEHQSMYTVMRADLQSMYTKLEERNSEITLLKTALRILGINFTSVKELQEWILSLKYEKVGQGSGPNDTNVTASAAAGPSFVATHDHSPNNAAGNKAVILIYFLVTLGILNASAAGRSFDANYALLRAFDAPNINHDPAAAGFSTPSAAGPSSGAYHFDFDNYNLFTDYYLAGTNGANITAFAASGPSFPNHGLPNNAPDNNPFSNDPTLAVGSPTASVIGSFFAANPELASAFDAPYNPSTSDRFTDHDLAAAGSSLIAGHDLPVMSDAPHNHDIISNLSTHHDPAAGFSTSSAAGFSSVANHNLHARKAYDISRLFTHDPCPR
ncbi:hypothetical protein POUND7_004253 [Theobroma cacao]